jgi:hypothetical protein
MTAPTLASPAAEVRRLRAQLVAVQNLLAEHLAADPSAMVTLETARRWAAEAAARAYASGVTAGRLEMVAELKRTDRGVVAAFELEIVRWGPGGRTHFADSRPGDYTGGPVATW